MKKMVSDEDLGHVFASPRPAGKRVVAILAGSQYYIWPPVVRPFKAVSQRQSFQAVESASKSITFFSTIKNKKAAFPRPF